MFPTYVGGVHHPPWDAVLRPLGEQLHEFARRAREIAAENPAWIAPSQVLAAQHLAQAAIDLQLCAEQVLRQSHDG